MYKYFTERQSSKPRTVRYPEWLDEVIHGVPEGMRHCSAVQLVGRWYGKGLCQAEVCMLLVAWNMLNLPPLGTSELESVDKSTRKWERPKELPPMSDEEANEIIREVRKQMNKKKP